MAAPHATPTSPLREAAARVPSNYAVRILEPAPPALKGNADDPTARGVVPQGAEVLSPVSSGDITWTELAMEDGELRAWAAERWLVPNALHNVPEGLVATRVALHQVAEQVVAPARSEATGGEIALRYTRGGFGTPFFADDRQVRVEGLEIVDQCNAAEGAHLRREAISTLRQAAGVLEGFVDAAALPDEPLEISRPAAEFLGEWFGFGTFVIAELRARAADDLEPATINLWPEHFDVATELGAESAGQRAAYGASPGDGDHDEPYLYVAPWTARPEGELWNATAFAGAELSYAELRAADNPVSMGVEFLEERLRALTE